MFNRQAYDIDRSNINVKINIIFNNGMHAFSNVVKNVYLKMDRVRKTDFPGSES